MSINIGITGSKKDGKWYTRKEFWKKFLIVSLLVGVLVAFYCTYVYAYSKGFERGCVACIKIDDCLGIDDDARSVEAL